MTPSRGTNTNFHKPPASSSPNKTPSILMSTSVRKARPGGSHLWFQHGEVWGRRIATNLKSYHELQANLRYNVKLSQKLSKWSWVSPIPRKPLCHSTPPSHNHRHHKAKEPSPYGSSFWNAQPHLPGLTLCPTHTDCLAERPCEYPSFWHFHPCWGSFWLRGWRPPLFSFCYSIPTTNGHDLSLKSSHN